MARYLEMRIESCKECPFCNIGTLSRAYCWHIKIRSKMIPSERRVSHINNDCNFEIPSWCPLKKER